MRLSVDDGCASDVRVADLAQKYEIETIFYWPVEWHSLAYENGYKPLSFNEAHTISKSFEIGSHTITHRHLTTLSNDDLVDEIGESMVMLSQLFNKKITKFASPRGYSNEEIDMLIDGFYESHRKTKQPGLVHIHPNSGVNNNRPWRDCVDENTEELFCHSWELDKYNLWDELEQFLKEQNERR